MKDLAGVRAKLEALSRRKKKKGYSSQGMNPAMLDKAKKAK